MSNVPVPALLGATSTKSSGGSVLWIFVIALGALYFLYLRPKSKKMRMQQTQARQPEVGDEVVTTGGIVGTVISMDAERAVISTGNGNTLTILRSAVARRIEPPMAPDDAEEPTAGGSGLPNASYDEEAAPGEGTPESGETPS